MQRFKSYLTSIFGGIGWNTPRRELQVVGWVLLVLCGGACLLQKAPKPQEPPLLTVRVQVPAPAALDQPEITPNPLLIIFNGSAARLQDIGKPAPGITLSPATPGTWRWESDQVLSFQPRQEWAIGASYRVQLDPAFFPSHVRLAAHVLDFQTPPFTFSIQNASFYVDPADPKVKQVVATLSFSHPVSPASLEQHVRLFIPDPLDGVLGHNTKIFGRVLSYDPHRGKAFIHSESIPIPMKAEDVHLRIESGLEAEAGGAGTDDPRETSVTVPGMRDYFSVRSVEAVLTRDAHDEPGQALVVAFSAGAAPAETAKRIQAFVLPKDLPAIQDRPAEKDYDWSEASMVGPEVLALSTPIALTPLPADRPFPEVHTFSFSAPQESAIFVRLRKGLPAYGGYVLADPSDTIVRAPSYPKELRLTRSGSILSDHGEKKISVLTRGIPAVRFRLERVLPDRINYLVSQTGGDFTNPQFTSSNFGPDDISEVFTQIRRFPSGDPRKAHYAAADIGARVSEEGGVRHGLFLLTAQSWDPKTQETTGLEDRRLILVTDMGLLIKEARDGSRSVFVQSVSSGTPVVGARISVLGKNGLAVATETTDAEGRVDFPPLTAFVDEKTPTAFLARKGADLSFIPFDWNDRRLDFSRFDVGGEDENIDPHTLTAFVFSDRGLYRPGDEIHAAFIVKAVDWTLSPAGVPLEAVITDPRGLTVLRQRIRLSPSGFDELHFTPEENAPTGTYQLGVYIVKDGKQDGLLGSTSMRVEEFLPDRMRIAAAFSVERGEGWVSPKDLKGLVSLRHLYGPPAMGHRVAGHITLAPGAFAFPSLQDFSFFDPEKQGKSFEEDLPDTKTDEKGEAEFPLDLSRYEAAAYRLTLHAEGFEAEGGRAVAAESSLLVSDLPYLLGYKPDADLYFISRGSERTVQLLAVDPSLKPVAARFEAQLLSQRYVSVLTRQEDGTWRYESVRKEVLLSTATARLSAAGLVYKLPTHTPGDFILSFLSLDGKERLRFGFSVAGAANLTRSLDKNAELSVRLDKPDYAPGSEIKVSLKAPYVGSGLITIERDRVYAAKWFHAGTTASLQHIQVPKDIEGNAYVNVAYVRAPDSPEVYMSPLSYGVAPFTVSRDRRRVPITLDVPAEARPGTTLHVRYKTDRPTKVVVYAVDEGILQVARYSTPDPLSFFYIKRSLSVRTAQILDLILPAFARSEDMAAPGGDAAAALGKNLNPFKRKRQKPVVCWSGIRDSGPDWRTADCELPDYFHGAVRVMAVAVAPDALGSAERPVKVRGPFVLDANVPTFAAPGDAFTVTVGVQNGVAGSGPAADVRVALDVSDALHVVGPSEVSVRIPEGQEGAAAFKIYTRAKPGSATLTFTASLSSDTSKTSETLSVRPAAAYRVTTISGHVRDGTVTMPIQRQLYPEFRSLQASVSTLPLGLSRGLIAYLQRYPYECTEQLISAAFPALVLRNRLEFGFKPEDTEAAVSRVVTILRARQNSEGGFGMWAANSSVVPLQSVYAMHFLTEAKEMGYAVPQDLFDKGLIWLNAYASNDPQGSSDARVHAYAIYILTRNAKITTAHLELLSRWLGQAHIVAWSNDLTSIYMAASYKMLQLDDQAENLIELNSLGQPQPDDYDWMYDSLARDGQLLYILARHFPERLKKVNGDSLECLINPIGAGRYNTMSSAYAVLALSAYADTVGEAPIRSVRLEERLAKGLSPLVLPAGLFPNAPFSPEARSLHLENRSDDTIFYQEVQSGFDTETSSAPERSGIEVFREYRDEQGVVVSSATLGAHLTVRLTLRAVDGRWHGNIAVVDLLPGGFEAELDHDGSPQGFNPDYMDIREDRVLLFGGVGPQAQTFEYKARATSAGRFRVPPAFAESMYDRGVQGRDGGGEFDVAQ